MSRFETEQAADEAGFTLTHRLTEQRFVIEQNDSVVGYARYTLFDDSQIDFDSTVVDPSLRGTGLSRLLVAKALKDDVVRNREVRASCWYVAEHIDRYPDSLAEGATYAGA